MKVAFLDRDGTLLREPPDQQVDSLEKFELIPGVIRGLQDLRDAGFVFVMVTNQDNLGSSRYPLSAYETIQRKLMGLFEGEGIRFEHTFVCPHTEEEGCECRKPKTGLVDALLRKGDINLADSWMIGDRESDVTFGRAVGVRTIRLAEKSSDISEADIRVPTFAEAVRAILAPRIASVFRKTLETDVTIDVTLDGTGMHDIQTGLGFFDHMLSLLVKHADFDAKIRAVGDLHVDEHHTVEDTGLVLGEAVLKALGSKNGIERYGYLLPMDEAEARVALDLGGRPYLKYDVPLKRERIGDVPTELFEDFFRAFSDGLRANLHIRAEGRNEHHIIEACFKALGRSLKNAVAVNPRLRNILPSTKGVL